ncbi:hypothetical protein NEIG_00200 [Nematocida sp. ERTm5]|nr:hypothetical protein NEIRO02_0631 [Nematocida sp. AWRm79]KAI5183903.1 hypothetical protein NEIRO03_1378 [Nematocida sp. AWRm78]OAG30688.1 hypothetical protein NEIG_00200 [Nematocida sp. ERTm5]
MDKLVRIKEQSIKRLEKDIQMYENELVTIQGEKEKEESSGNDYYALRTIEQRSEETRKALESTQTILKKTKAELDRMNNE